jgi:hypothetical protein
VGDLGGGHIVTAILAILNDENAIGGGGFTPVNHVYTSGTGVTETIPTGAATVIIEDWGGQGSGNHILLEFGAAGGYVKKTLSLYPSNWGQTFTFTVGPGGATGNNDGTASSITNGTYPTALNLAAGGGQSAQHGGTGGSASGGDVNTVGATSGTPTIGVGGASYGGSASMYAGYGGACSFRYS